MLGIGPATSSGEKSASTVIYTRPCYLHGFEVVPPNIGYSVLKVYDSSNTSTAGKTIIAEATVAAGQNSIYLSFMTPRVANNGVYAELTNTSGSTTFVLAFSPA